MKRKNFNRNKRVRKRYLDLQYRLDNGLLKGRETDAVFALVRQNTTRRLCIIKAYQYAAFMISSDKDFWSDKKIIDTYPKHFLVIPAPVIYGSGAVAIKEEEFKEILLSECRRYHL